MSLEILLHAKKKVPEEIENINASNSEVEILEPKEVGEILSKAEIHADKFLGKILTVDMLAKEGLSPVYKAMTKNGPVCFFSPPYELGEGRIAVVAYVESDGHVVVRSYYRSNSQGVWRYLPSYILQGEKISWYNKGHGEESITLPIVFQKTLAKISEQEVPEKIVNPELVFAGTAKNFLANLEKTGNPPETFRVEVGKEPQTLGRDFYRSKKSDPAKLELNPELSPDFSKLTDTWNEQSNLYGPIVIEVFASKDGKLNFMFCRDKNNRAWIGGIENNSEIKSTGLRKTWVGGGDLTTPAYEYEIHTDGYGNEETRNGYYVDMYKNYLSRAPIIQDYLLSKGLINKKEISKTDNEKNIKTDKIELPTIKNAKNINELIQAIDNLPNKGLQGSKGFYSSSKLKDLIRKVLWENLKYEYLPNKECGLRDKVKELSREAIKQ